MATPGRRPSRRKGLLEINGTRLTVAEALVRIDSALFERPLMRMLIDGCLVEEQLAADPVDLTPAEIQDAADAFRRAKGLHQRTQTERWLTDRGLQTADFTRLVTRHAELATLRRRVAEGRIQDWFAAHRSELDIITIAWVAADAADHTALRKDPLAAVFNAAAAGRPAGMVQRTAAELHRAELGVGELFTMELAVPAVATVVAAVPAVLDDRTQVLVQQRLFDEWLAERRSAARINWFWGDQRRTAS